MPHTSVESLSRRDHRRNYVLGVINGALFMMSDVFIDSGMVLTWFLAQLDAPNLLIGLVSPVRMGGWFLPQVFASGYLQRQPRKLPFYRALVFYRGAALLCMTLVVALLPTHSGWMLGLFFASLLIYSLGAGLGGIAFMDMVGRVIPAARRGSFFGQRMFWGNVLALGTSSLIGFLLGEPDGLRFPDNFAIIFGMASVFLTISMGSWCFVKEPLDVVDATRVRWTEQLVRGMRLFRDDAPFRTFILARLLLMLAQLAAPFYVVYARSVLGISARMIGVYLTARTAASILSNLLWGKISDRQGNRRLIQLTNGIGLSVPLLALLVGTAGSLFPSAMNGFAFLFTVVFVAAGAFGTGSTIGNINYLLDLAPPDRRPLYLGFSNTVFGIGIFTSALGGLIVDWAGFPAVMILSACFYGAALIFSFLMIEPRVKPSRT